ncbi:hypothetical protein [Streptomyces sp. NRRL S-350]|nr:hypothetical protein [Streptomyces sp. NRRL S-350]
MPRAGRTKSQWPFTGRRWGSSSCPVIGASVPAAATRNPALE